MAKARAILTRVTGGAVMIAALVGVLVVDHLNWLGSELGDVRGTLLAAVVAVLGVLALLEIARLSAAAGVRLLTVSGVVGVLVVGTLPVWRQMLMFGMVLEDVWCVFGLIMVAAFLEQMVRFRIEQALVRLGATLLAVLYLGVGAALMLTIRLDRGVGMLVLFLAAVKCTDIGAYFTGTAIGRHKLIPWLSPGKSWEGLIGGLASAAGVGALAAQLLGRWQTLDTGLSLGEAAVFGVVVGAAGQFADLCESLLKRSAAVKDSGSLVPEFGGVLDILDSPLLAAPVAYLLLAALS